MTDDLTVPVAPKFNTLLFQGTKTFLDLVEMVAQSMIFFKKVQAYTKFVELFEIPNQVLRFHAESTI